MRLYVNFDIERLMDLVEEESNTYFDYCHKAKTLYNGDFDKLMERKKSVDYARQSHDRAEDAVRAIIEVFHLDIEAQSRLYIAARSVRRWRIATEYARFIPDNMQEQIRRFVFGTPVAPSSICERCGCWEV